MLNFVMSSIPILMAGVQAQVLNVVSTMDIMIAIMIIDCDQTIRRFRWIPLPRFEALLVHETTPSFDLPLDYHP
jgi:hypothetical protein